jgi:hypothetical protein
MQFLEFVSAFITHYWFELSMLVLTPSVGYLKTQLARRRRRRRQEGDDTSE